MENDTQEGKGKSRIQLIVVFLIGFLLGIFVGPTFLGNYVTTGDDADNTPVVSEEEDGNVMEDTDTNGANSVTVSDQLAGDRVLLEEVTLEKSGWAVVHEDLDGVPGNALGAQRFDPGTNMNGHVELLRNTEPENLYYVILYADDGDGEFNIKTDTPLTDTEGAYISSTFKTILVDRKTD